MRKCTAQKIEALAIELGMHEREAGNITARMREADGESALPGSIKTGETIAKCGRSGHRRQERLL